MKVVLDTNALVSGMLTPGGTCASILLLALEGSFQICVDHRMLDEYRRILAEPRFGFAPAEADEILAFVDHTAEKVAAPPLYVRLPDPDDQPFLEVAHAAGAVIVTGNRRHFPAGACAGVRVLSPRDFLEVVRAAGRRGSPDKPGI
ncbi:MAG: putative toxin-antitoxin system toxin component, PIN family [Kiritimatiellae bacterium]|nr:putative toxin-antitoxin system toxin component, PIN family [Kiritimatiellia bacterium]